MNLADLPITPASVERTATGIEEIANALVTGLETMQVRTTRAKVREALGPLAADLVTLHEAARILRRLAEDYQRTLDTISSFVEIEESPKVH